MEILHCADATVQALPSKPSGRDHGVAGETVAFSAASTFWHANGGQIVHLTIYVSSLCVYLCVQVQVCACAQSSTCHSPSHFFVHLIKSCHPCHVICCSFFPMTLQYYQRIEAVFLQNIFSFFLWWTTNISCIENIFSKCLIIGNFFCNILLLTQYGEWKGSALSFKVIHFEVKWLLFSLSYAFYKPCFTQISSEKKARETETCKKYGSISSFEKNAENSSTLSWHSKKNATGNN